MLMIWISLFLPLITLSGSHYSLNARYNHILSQIDDPKLIGPGNLCLVFGSVIATYSAGGDLNDVFSWEVINSSGEVIFAKNGGEQLQSIQVVFSEIGNYTVKLKVRRGTDSNFFEEQLLVRVQMGPELAILSDYLLCAGAPANLVALDPTTPNLSDFTIEWTDIEGNIIGTGNELLAYNPGFYLFELFQTDALGIRSCVITGSTFVGPPIDFEIVPSSTSICEGSTINFRLDTPLSGDWFIQKDFTGTRTSISRGFEISINTNDLLGPGLYLVTFQTSNPIFPNCTSEKIIGFEVLKNPELTATIVDRPDECTSQNGSFTVILNSDIDSLYIPELDVIEGPFAAGEEITFSNLLPQVYSVVINKNGCQITELVVMDAVITPTQLNPTVTLQEETCNSEGINNGIVTVDFGSSIPSIGEYRVLILGKGEIEKGEIPIDGQFEINLLTGSYLLEFKVEGCTYPIQTIQIEGAPQVEFTVPRSLNICETFSLKPESDQNLNFILTFPDGRVETINSEQSFQLTDAGSYTIVGVSQDENSSLCPRKIEFVASFSPTISFAPILAVEKCFDPIKYEVELEGIALEAASIRWLNEEGKIVGRGPIFYPPSLGSFSLLVQPTSSGFCPVVPVSFEVVNPVTSVTMDLKADKICPSPSVSFVTLETNENEVKETEWIFFDENDGRRELEEFDGLFEIEVSIPGTYEVVAYNLLGCEIGRNYIRVEGNEVLALPNLEEEYGVCIKGNKGPLLDPGAFEEYFWYMREQLVSTSPQFSPQKVGDYSLRVITSEGCEIVKSFSTFDACSFEYVFPNAMILDDPKRNFEVRVTEGIAEVQLFILNRQGSLIHHDQSEEIPFGEAFLKWDGKVNGANIPTGTYVIVLIGKNSLYQFEEKITGSLLVLE